MYNQKSPVFASLCLLAMCIVVTSFFSACSGSGGDAQNSGTGGISFKLVMQPSSGSGAHILTPAFNSCVDYGIGTIAATVSSGTTTVTSNSFPCAAHQGVILGVPAGSNYTLQVEGLSSGMATIWRGLISSITVTTGQTTNAGTITMSYVGGNTASPTVTLIGPNSNPTSTTNVPITDRINIAFSQPMAISTITSTNITLNNGSAVPGTVSYNSASNTAAFIPSSPLSYNTQYALQVMSCVTGSCIEDIAGIQLMNSSYANTFTTESAPTGTANAPTALTATPGDGQVTLDWLAVNGATSYNVYYSTSPGVTTTNGTQILGVGAPAVHLGLTNGTTYYYIVTAVNSFGESLASAQSSTTPAFPSGNPLPPASLAVNFNNGVSPYTVTWPTVSGMSYNLYWSTRPIYPDHTAADNVIRYVTPGDYIHTGVTSGLTYCYIVTAMNSAGESADSMQVCGPGGGFIQIVW
ncbi:MAG TPA: Ig-like domain-containing protein [Nitrospirota bacterium]|nr:Ig-like domain-containing protein [Nitrospirota bacterium]